MRIVRKIALALSLIAALSGCSHSVLDYNAKIGELDVGSDRIYFARETVNESDLRIYSIKSNGTSEGFEFTESSASWEPKAIKGTLFESMGTVKGTLDSPDGESRVEVKSSAQGSELWVTMGQEKRLIVRASGPLENLGISEIKWLPNSKGVIIVNNAKIGIFDISSGKYAYLTDGWMVLAND